jgi:hypothetical protein
MSSSEFTLSRGARTSIKPFQGTLLSKYFVGVLIKLYKGEQSNTDLKQLIVRVCIYILHHFNINPKNRAKKITKEPHLVTIGTYQYQSFQNIYIYILSSGRDLSSYS